MRHISLSAVVVTGLFLASCGPAPVQTNTEALMNSNAPVMNANDTPMPLNSNTGTGSTSAARSMTYTVADVAAHATPSDCYASVAGDVYDLTKWVNEHPGGPQAISAVCGKDITSMQHPGGAAMAEQVQLIQEYKIGILTQ